MHRPKWEFLMLFIHIYVVYIFTLPCCKVNSFWVNIQNLLKMVIKAHIFHDGWWLLGRFPPWHGSWTLVRLQEVLSRKLSYFCRNLQKSLVALHNTLSEKCLNYTKRCNANRTWRRIATTQPVMLNHAFLYLLLKITLIIVFSEFFPQFNLGYGGFFNI